MDRAETDGQDEESAHMANEERPNSSDELNNLPELDNEPKNTEGKLSRLCFINHNLTVCIYDKASA